MSIATLEPNALYILLFVRDDPPKRSNFHWGLYLHRDAISGGTKYHIKQQSTGWMADHGPTAGVFKSFLLVGLVKIAMIPVGRQAWTDQTFRTYDTQLDQPGITCRVWLLWVLKLLQDAKVLKCNDLEALQAEVLDWGNTNAVAAANNVQPRPVAASSLCGL